MCLFLFFRQLDQNLIIQIDVVTFQVLILGDESLPARQPLPIVLWGFLFGAHLQRTFQRLLNLITYSNSLSFKVLRNRSELWLE